MLTHSQTMGAQSPYTFHYTYNLAGGLEKFTFPSGRKVTSCYDAASRLNKVRNGESDSPPPYASVTQFWPHGAVQTMTLGNNVVENSSYNNRLQPTSMSAGNLLSLAYDYGTAPNLNNGSVLSQTITWNGLSPITQYYQYDAVNRVKLASENPTNASNLVCPDAGSSWCQQFSNDAFGNRLIAQRSNVGSAPPLEPTAYDSNTNRITQMFGGSDIRYDFAGNLTKDGLNET
ncbi:MAG: hypothetical protein LAP38_09355, partial [Acidobacteriia bacterium]|nr:hypothetical protein [Terriglobia bacterium]